MNEDNLSPRLRTGTAHLTREGILFAGTYYSCSRAIREGWFKPSLPAGRRSLSVAYSSEAYPPAELYIETESSTEEHLTARMVRTEELDPAFLEAYQAKFRSLLEARRRQREAQLGQKAGKAPSLPGVT